MPFNTNNLPTAATVLTSDQQTGLPTLIRLCIDLNEQLQQRSWLTLIVCAIDGLPHETADAAPPVVAEIAQLVANTAAIPHAQLYRTAYDSFALVLPETSRTIGMKTAEAIRSGIEQLGQGVSATLAVASAPHDAAEAGALLAVCEVQLLDSSELRNRVVAASPVESLPPATARLVNLLVARLITLAKVGEQLRITEQQAYNDMVTGLPNARALEQTLPRYIERCAHTNTPLALLLIDGDNLKEYNTRYGYDAGNEWIRSIATTVAENLRPGDFVARWLMGDEFVVLLPNTPRDQAHEVAERLRVAVEQAGATSNYPGTISIGVVAVTTCTNPATILEQAREALVAAKGRGRNQIALLDV